VQQRRGQPCPDSSGEGQHLRWAEGPAGTEGKATKQAKEENGQVIRTGVFSSERNRPSSMKNRDYRLG